MHTVRFNGTHYEVCCPSSKSYLVYDVLELFCEYEKEDAYALCSYLNGGNKPEPKKSPGEKS